MPLSHLRAAVLVTIAAAVIIANAPRVQSDRPVPNRVEIRRDTFGIPHILAEDEEAAGFGFGYAMAEDHAADLGRRYLQARGEASRYFGPADAQSDLAMQAFNNREAAKRALTKEVGKNFRRWLQGFAAGINHYVASHRETLPQWMPVVDPSDPLAYGRMSAIRSASQAPASLRAKYPAATATPTTMDNLNGEGPNQEDGSNALALAGSKTTSQRPILLGNPHLRWSSLYWEAHVTVPGRINFYGSTLVGVPVLRAGFNDRLGYVQTNNAPDLEDIYSLALDAARSDTFLHNGRKHRIERRPVSIEVKQLDGRATTEERDFEQTKLGPVIHRTKDRLFVIRSVELDWWRHFEGFFELLHARSLREFRGTLERRLSLTSNYTYADIDGNILYAWNARLPRRPDPNIDYSLDVPGDTRRFFWKGIHAGRDLPTVLNPPSGYVQNANNAPWWTTLRDRLDPARYPSYMERAPLSLRAQVPLQALEATPRFSTEDVLRLKFTTRVLLAERMLPDLIAAVRTITTPSEDLEAGLRILQAWDGRVGAGSRGAVLFERFLSIYGEQRPDRFRVPWDPQQPTSTPVGLSDAAAAVRALERAVVDVRQRYGAEDVAWGEVNRFRFGDIDLPGDGWLGPSGLYRVLGFDPAADGKRVAGNLTPGSPLAGFGDAWVMMVHFTRPVSAWSVLAYGQTSDLGSPHSKDQIRLFANHQLRPVWFSEAEIAANLERRYRP